MDPEKTPEDVIIPEESKVEEVVPPVAEVTPEKDTPADGSDKTPKPVVRAEGEDSERFNLRQQLKAAQQNFVAAESEDDKSLFKSEMKKIRTQLYQHSISTPKPTETTTTDTIPNEEEEKNIKENLKKLGYVSKEEVIAEARRVIREEMSESQAAKNEGEHAKVITDFYASRPDIASDNELKQGLEAYVLSNFKVSPATPPEQLAQYLKMAASFFVPPTTPTKDTAPKDAEDKVDLMNVTGNNAMGTERTDAGKKAEIQSLKAMGWTDEKIKNFYEPIKK